MFRSSDVPNEVVIFFNTNDTAKGKDFVTSAHVKSSMEKAGVVDRPTFYFLESTEPLRVIGSGWIELFRPRSTTLIQHLPIRFLLSFGLGDS